MLIAGAALSIHAAHYDYLSDDAFISARYARNLVQGLGLVWNPGERVEGYTSLAWVLLLAAFGSLHVDYVWAMRALGFACAVGCLIASHSIASRRLTLAPVAAAAVPALIAASAPIACWSTAGLETTAFALAILLSLLAFGSAPTTKSAAAEGACAAACVLLRPEGVLVPLCLALTRSAAWNVRDTLRAWPALVSPAIALASQTAFRQVYYGDLLPNTARAKQAMAGQWPYGLHYARDFFADYGTLPVWLCVLVVSMLERRSGRPVAQAAGVVIVALIAALIWVGGDGLSMYRFFVPVMPLFALACGCAADSLWRRVDSKSREIAFGMRVIVLSALCAVGVTWATPDHQHDQYRWYEYQQSVEVPRWRQVGLWLAHHTPRTASIACVPIGAIGYYSERVVRDMVGLTDRHIASLPPDPKLTWVGHRKHDGPYILSLKPSILLLANVRVRVVAAALDDPNFGKSPDPMIFMREQDVFGPELARDYEPRIAQISNSRYLHYYARRNEP